MVASGKRGSILAGMTTLAVWMVSLAIAEAPPRTPTMLAPRLGVPAPEGTANRGLRVDRITHNLPAARLGLEVGDIVVSVDSMRFTSYGGFQHALRCAGQRPSFIITDVRTGRLMRRTTDLPHQQPRVCEPVPPDSYWMSVDLRDEVGP